MSMMPPNQPEEETNSRTWMIFAVVTSVLVLIGIIALVVIGILPRMTNPAQSLTDSDGPFLTLKRPLPESTNLYDIFPVQVGDFMGEQWLGDVDSGFTITYKRGADALIVTGRKAVNTAAARFLVEEIRNRQGPANRAESIVPGNFFNSYYLDVRDSGTRFAWSRDVWYFDIQAASLESLTAFMSVFKY